MELDPHELYDVLRARQEVFVVEQRCAYLDLDGADPRCHHMWTRGEDGTVAAYLRIVPPRVKYDEPSLGRIMTSAGARGTGLGRELMMQGLSHLESLFGVSPVRIAAQAYLVEFYSRFGFRRTGFDFDEDGIPHCEMLRAPSGATIF